MRQSALTRGLSGLSVSSTSSHSRSHSHQSHQSHHSRGGHSRTSSSGFLGRPPATPRHISEERELQERHERPGSNPRLSPGVQTPAHYALMDPGINSIKRRYPWLFFEAYRSAVYSQKDMPATRVVFDSNKLTLEVQQRSRPGGTTNEPGPQGTIPEATLIKQMDDTTKTQLIARLDMECRRNQFVFHGKFFIFDAIYKTFKEYRLTSKDVHDLRQSCLNWHDDWQSKFLFTGGLKPWCQEFAKSNRDIFRLAAAIVDDATDADERREAQQEYQAIMKTQLTKPTFDSIWRLFSDLLDYETTFHDEHGLASFFVRLVFLTLTPMMFRYIHGGSTDRNLKQDIIDTYRSLAFEQRFADVDKDIFNWVESAPKRRKTGKTDATLNKYVWHDEAAPPPPASHKPGPRYSLPDSAAGDSPALSSASRGSHHTPTRRRGDDYDETPTVRRRGHRDQYRDDTLDQDDMASGTVRRHYFGGDSTYDLSPEMPSRHYDGAEDSFADFSSNVEDTPGHATSPGPDDDNTETLFQESSDDSPSRAAARRRSHYY
ncbi:hypothetical protein F4782DRAFT_95555 [Xylaria castorea]|nr:hypothetical protein F4782DRAFT_95555 [Xylaria castorea]